MKKLEHTVIRVGLVLGERVLDVRVLLELFEEIEVRTVVVSIVEDTSDIMP